MEKFLIEYQWIIWIAIVWSVPWKGVALWKAARNSHKIWFIAILILNTLAILEILYIFIFSRKKDQDQTQSYTNDPTRSNGNGINLIRGL